MAATTTAKRGYTATKDQLLNRLRRIEGQVRGVERMVEEDRYCIDVITQISAIQAALDKVALGLLDDHAAHCVIGGGADGAAGGAQGRADGGGGAPDAARLSLAFATALGAAARGAARRRCSITATTTPRTASTAT